jgi:hypothetical protein
MNQETTKTGNMFLVGRDRRARCSGVSATQPKRDQNGSGTLRTPEAPTARADRAGREAQRLLRASPPSSPVAPHGQRVNFSLHFVCL